MGVDREHTTSHRDDVRDPRLLADFPFGRREDVGIRRIDVSSRLDPDVETSVKDEQDETEVGGQHETARSDVARVVAFRRKWVGRIPQELHDLVVGPNLGPGR